MRDVVANERNILTQALTLDDDCQCEVCKNGELLLEAIKLHFHKAKQQELADDLTSEPLVLVELGVCSFKSYSCITGQCEKCLGKTAISSLCEQLEHLAHITYFCWVKETCGKKEARCNWWKNGCNIGGFNDGNKKEMPPVQDIPPILWAKVPKKIFERKWGDSKCWLF